jgi:THAP4-like, heme-binding beta-barrel domain
VPIQLDADLPVPLIPLAWLVGRWAGAGVAGYPTMEGDLRFGQEVSFTHEGRPFLTYTSQTWLLDDDGRQVRPLASETGYWRPAAALPGEHAENPDADAESSEVQGSGVEGSGVEGSGVESSGAGETGPGSPIEVLLAHPSGYVEIYHGAVDGPRVMLETDAVVRTRTAKDYAAATRMYGLVEGDLLWVMDMAAGGVRLTSHASARLKRVPDA